MPKRIRRLSIVPATPWVALAQQPKPAAPVPAKKPAAGDAGIAGGYDYRAGKGWDVGIAGPQHHSQTGQSLRVVG